MIKQKAEILCKIRSCILHGYELQCQKINTMNDIIYWLVKLGIYQSDTKNAEDLEDAIKKFMVVGEQSECGIDDLMQKINSASLVEDIIYED